MDKALEHLHNSCSFYRKQLKAGRLFLHEAPWNATSWKDPEVKELADRPDTYLVRGTMCRWEMMATDRCGLQGTGYVRKETGWLTNSRELAELLEGECSNKAGKDPGTGMYTSFGGIAKQAARYPPALVKTVLRTAKAYLVQKGELNSMESNTSGPICEEPSVPAEYWGDVNGGLLAAEEVKKARTLEMDYFKKQGVYRKVPVTQCYTEGLRPITVRWLDTNKGDPEKPNYRSRLVAREIKAAKKPEEQLPQNLLLEAMRYLLSAWATDRVSAKGRRLKLGLWDISRAHFYGVPKRRIYVELPPEDAEQGFCGLLEKSMYGCQDAPAIWQDRYTQLLLQHGFQRGRSNGSCFYKPSTGCRVLVHGDDLLALGDQEALDELDSTLRSAYELKRLGMLGDDHLLAQHIS